MFTYDHEKIFEKPTECRPDCVQPVKRPFTLPEHVHGLSMELKHTLERLACFEETITRKSDELSRMLTQDNVLFKDIIRRGWEDFIKTVQTEINLFETNSEATITLFKQSINSELDKFNRDYSENYEAFHTEVSDAVAFMKANLNDTLEELLQSMEANGQLIGMVETDLCINVKKFGAVGDGATDDTNAFKTAIERLENGGTLFVPRGTYLVNGSIVLASNIKMVGDAKPVIKMNANDLDEYAIIDITNAENVTVENIALLGDRDTHTGTTGECGMGIKIRGSSNVTIKDCSVAKCWGDGIYIGTGNEACNNVTIESCTIDNNRRNGVSVINCDGLILANSLIKDTKGTAPQHGICFECNNDDEFVKNAIVTNCIFTGNKYGIGLGGSTNVYEISIDGCTFGAANGVYLCRTMQDGINGYFIIRNSVFNSEHGIVFDAKTVNGIPVLIENCQFLCSLVPVRIGYPELDFAGVIGGITINNCTFAKWGETQYPIMIRGGVNAGTSYNQIFVNSCILPKPHSFVFASAPSVGTLSITLDSVPKKSLTGDTSLNGSTIFTRADINCASGDKVITLEESFPYGVEVEFRVTGSNAYSLTFECANGIFAQADSAKSITVSGIYTTIRIRHESANRWSFSKINND